MKEKIRKEWKIESKKEKTCKGDTCRLHKWKGGRGKERKTKGRIDKGGREEKRKEGRREGRNKRLEGWKG